MPRCLIVYFSQGGSTAKVAEEIAGELRGKGYDIDVRSLTQVSPQAVLGYDLVGLGSPVYAFGQPFNVVDLVRSLPDLNGRAAFLFNTYGTYAFDAGTRFAKLVKEKGARVLGYFACHGKGSYLGYAKVGWLFSASHPNQEDLQNARRFALVVAAKAGGQGQHDGDESAGSPAPFIYRLERFFTNQWLTSRFYSRFFKADASLCNRCGLCSRKCPTSNIGQDDSGLPAWGRRCIGCLMCEMNCPKDAIRSPTADWAVIRPLLKYNVKVASADPSLEAARAKHSRGKIVLV